MTKDFEDRYPFLVSAVITFAASGLLFSRWTPSARPIILQGLLPLFAPALNISALAVGFLATSQSILFSLPDAGTKAELKRSGHYGRLQKFIKGAISSSFVWALLSAWLSTFHLAKPNVLRSLAVCVWIFTCTYSITCYYRASRILTYVLSGDEEGGTVSKLQAWNPDEHEDG